MVPTCSRYRGGSPSLRSTADKAHFIDNRNDSKDASKWAAKGDEINAFILKGTHGKYSTLYDLIAAESPGELREYGKMLKGGEQTRLRRNPP